MIFTVFCNGQFFCSQSIIIFGLKLNNDTIVQILWPTLYIFKGTIMREEYDDDMLFERKGNYFLTFSKKFLIFLPIEG